MAPAWPADRPERRAVASLRPFPRNARKHSDDQIAQVAASITEWGWTNAVLVDESGEIIAGHARVLAAQRLGLADIPVIVARGWSSEQRRAYLIADNRLTELGRWDNDLLALELGDLKDIGFDLALTGFSQVDVNEIFARAKLKSGRGDPDDSPDLPAVAFSQPGDVWTLGDHRLACGDCTNVEAVAKALNGARPHLMVTDPPYGVDYDPAWRTRIGMQGGGASGKVLNDHRADWREAWALFAGDVAYVWHATLNASTFEESLKASGFVLRNQIIWAKDRLVISQGHYHWQHEPCWYAVRGSRAHWEGDRKQSTAWFIDTPRRSETGHSTQKPVECMLRPMLNNSRAGQSVYEPFMGSGTTLIAAEQSGRHCFGLELNPAYVDVAVRRWQDFTGERARREGDGAMFPAEPGEKQGDETRRQADEARTQAGADGTSRVARPSA